MCTTLKERYREVSDAIFFFYLINFMYIVAKTPGFSEMQQTKRYL
jgi:hypothetical protein